MAGKPDHTHFKYGFQFLPFLQTRLTACKNPNHPSISSEDCANQTILQYDLLIFKLLLIVALCTIILDKELYQAWGLNRKLV